MTLFAARLATSRKASRTLADEALQGLHDGRFDGK